MIAIGNSNLSSASSPDLFVADLFGEMRFMPRRLPLGVFGQVRQGRRKSYEGDFSKELETNVDAVMRSSQKERIVISRKGKPCAVFVGIQDYDAKDLELASSPDFWLMIRQRRVASRSIPLADVESQMETHLGKAAPLPAVARKTRKRTNPTGAGKGLALGTDLRTPPKAWRQASNTSVFPYTEGREAAGLRGR
jgi:hypothetical protein